MDNEEQIDNLDNELEWQKELAEQREAGLENIQKKNAENNESDKSESDATNNKEEAEGKDKPADTKAKQSKNSKSVKKKSKMLLALGRLILSGFLDLSAWGVLFKEKPLLAVGLSAGIIIFLIVVLMLLIVLVVRGVCEIGGVVPFWSADKCVQYILN